MAVRSARPAGAAAIGRARNRWQRRWFGGLLGCLGIEVQRDGAAPAAPFLLVSNHVSYLDIMVLGAELDGTFVSKAEVGDWPVLGNLLRLSGTLLLKRESKRALPQIAGQMQAILEEGRGLILFPEGTTSDGETVMPFRASLLEPAVRHEIPVSHATLCYETGPGDPPPREAVCWWGGMTFAPHLLGVLGMKRIRARLVFGKSPLIGEDRKMLADRLREAVAAGLPPKRAARAAENL